MAAYKQQNYSSNPQEQLSLVPNKIWNSIFKYLGFKDRWHCAGACSTWCNVILNMPESIFKNHELQDQIQVAGCDDRLLLLINLDDPLFHQIVKMLSFWKKNVFEGLCFRSQYISNNNMEALSRILRSIDPPIKQLRFSNCYIPIQAIPMLISFSDLGAILFDDGVNKLYDNEEPIPVYKFKSPSSLTYLHLSFSLSEFLSDEETDKIVLPLSEIFRQCPNLQHLTLGCRNQACQTVFAKQALKHCSRLKSLEVYGATSRRAYPAISIELGPIEIEFGAGDGLHSFTHDARMSESINTDIYNTVLAKSYTTLKVLNLRYDGHKVNRDLISALAGLPILQKFHIWHDRLSEIRLPPITSELTTLIGPHLKEIVIDFGMQSSRSNANLKTNDEILMTIAKGCPLLCHLEIIGRYRYSGETMLDFASTVESSLFYLVIDMDRTKALSLVVNLVTLMTFGFAYDGDGLTKPGKPDYEPLTREDEEYIRHILKMRGGSLKGAVR